MVKFKKISLSANPDGTKTIGIEILEHPEEILVGDSFGVTLPMRAKDEDLIRAVKRELSERIRVLKQAKELEEKTADLQSEVGEELEFV